MATKTTKTVTFVAFTVIDADAHEKFATTDFESYDAAMRERNRLALTYGKQFCLEVAGIDAQGQLHADITD